MRIRHLLTASLALCCLAFPAFAQQIRNIDETVVLRSDGSARVTQVWDVTVVSGTEFYLPFDNLGPMDITDLSVIENGVVFASEGDYWDTDRTREQKRGRCGIVRKGSGSLELCWGEGEYGDHVWTVNYTVHGLAMRMGEYNGLYFSFVNPGLSAPPQHVKVMIYNETGGPAWTTENVKVWGFRSDSEIFVEDGAIRAESKAPFGRNDAMTVLVRFDPDLFVPEITFNKDFEKVQKMAFEGSDYKKKMSFWETVKTIFAGIFIVAMLLLSPGGILAVTILVYLYMWIASMLGFKYKRSIFGESRIKGWYRDVPLEGNIHAAYYALTKGMKMEGMGGPDPSKHLIGAYFLRWVLDGNVTVLPDPGNENRVNLSFEKDCQFPDTVENDLYKMVREASGSNLILEAGEFEKWAKKSFRKVSDLPEREKTRGRKWFQDKHYMLRNDVCNDEGKEQARHLIEFKNFLEDFTLSGERSAIEVTLWKDYLVFAALFGIADKVAKEFQKLYPGQFEQFTQTAGLTNATLFDMMQASNRISATAMRNAAAEKSAHSSSGGSSGGRSWRSGGGGGFSIGGGGGSFGGSFGGGSR